MPAGEAHDAGPRRCSNSARFPRPRSVPQYVCKPSHDLGLHGIVTPGTGRAFLLLPTPIPALDPMTPEATIVRPTPRPHPGSILGLLLLLLVAGSFHFARPLALSAQDRGTLQARASVVSADGAWAAHRAALRTLSPGTSAAAAARPADAGSRPSAGSRPAEAGRRTAPGLEDGGGSTGRWLPASLRSRPPTGEPPAPSGIVVRREARAGTFRVTVAHAGH